MSIDKQAQYKSKFSRLWERFDEASHGNAEQMRDILEVTLDALESAERNILRLEKLAEAESVGADKAAASGVEWMKRCQAAEKRIAELGNWQQESSTWQSVAEKQLAIAIEAEKRIAELEAREVKLPQRQEPTSSGHYGEGYLVPSNAGSALDYEETVEAIRAAGISVKGE